MDIKIKYNVMRKIVLNFRSASKTSIATLLVFVMTFISCEFIDDLPEANSIADETPPSAFFTFTNGPDVDTFTEVTFANQSNNATNFSWDLGDGKTSTEIDPVNVYPGEGSFTVTLTVTDALNQTATHSETIELIEPEVPDAITPVIGAPDFEDVDGVCGSGDSRDCWRLDGATIHQTTSDGEGNDTSSKTRGVKYPSGSDDNRVTYQAFTVSPNSQYVLIVRYALQSDGDSIRASVIDGQLDNFSEFATATLLGQESGTTNNGKGNFNTIRVEFETNSNEEISILFDHDGNTSDSFLDNVLVEPIL